MVEANIEDLAFSSRHQGKPALPAGHECLSTRLMRENGTHLLESFLLNVLSKCAEFRVRR